MIIIAIERPVVAARELHSHKPKSTHRNGNVRVSVYCCHFYFMCCYWQKWIYLLIITNVCVSVQF